MEKRKSAAKKLPQKKKKVEKRVASSRKKSPSEIDQIMARILAELDQPQQVAIIKKPLGTKFKINAIRGKSPLTDLGFAMPAKRIPIPAMILLLILLSGFWGRDIVKGLGFPIEPTPFTAIYFDNPHIAGTGIKVGSKVVFGINNGSFESRTFKWSAKISGRNVAKGSIELEPYGQRKLEISIKRASPGEFLEISVDKLKTPIAAVITG
jgi:hypothetical protein